MFIVLMKIETIVLFLGLLGTIAGYMLGKTTTTTMPPDRQDLRTSPASGNWVDT